jgi:hypothetical protein
MMLLHRPLRADEQPDSGDRSNYSIRLRYRALPIADAPA